MFDKYMIYKDDCKNVLGEKGEATAFQIGLRVTYYRGIIIALIKDLKISVDGKAYSVEDMTFTFNGSHTYRFEEMFGVTEERWNFGDVMIVTIAKDGGLSAGAHEVEVTQTLRVSYGLMETYHPNVAHWKTTVDVA